MTTIHILNGPNLNLLGHRQPEIYGRETLDDVAAACRRLGAELGLEVALYQSNHEGEIVEMIHRARTDAQGIVINPGAYSHTSIAILDALQAFEGPVIEVHISNIHKRESFRHHSYVSLRADGVIAGLGTEGYRAALRRMATLLRSRATRRSLSALPSTKTEDNAIAAAAIIGDRSRPKAGQNTPAATGISATL